jgi:glucose/arabinose dehydrogenase
MMKRMIFLFLALLLTSVAPAAWAADEQRLGAHFDIRAEAMPVPYATRSASNESDTISRPANITLQVPTGFTASIFADGLKNPRWFAVAKNGDVFVAESDAGKVTLLRDADGDDKVEFKAIFTDGLAQPHGLAFHDNALYVAHTRAV